MRAPAARARWRCWCCAAPAQRRRAAADAVLAADRLAALRPSVDEVVAQARRRCRRRREPGYVLGFQEQALVDSKDPDAKPLPVDKMMVHHFLYFTRGRVDARPGRLPRRRVHRRARGGAPERALRRAWPPEQRARYGIRNATPERRRAGVAADRDGHEPLQAAQALLRAHEGLVHDRAAHAGLSGRRSATARTWSTAWPTTCRAAASRGRRSWTARRGRCRSAAASSAAARTTTAAR